MEYSIEQEQQLMKHCYLLRLLGWGLVLWHASSVYAVANYTHFGRYLSVTNTPSGHDPYELNMTVQRAFPHSVKTVGQAIQATLNQTAYQLVPEAKTDPAIKAMYHKPLPVYLRSIGPMPLKMALLSLSGHVYQLAVDPVHRLITYKIRNPYRTL